MKWSKQASNKAGVAAGVCAALMWCGVMSPAQASDDVVAKEIWRAAYVVQDITAQAAHPLTAQAHDCRAQTSAANAESAQWVVLRYRRVPGDVYMVAPVAAGLTLKPGQSVLVNVLGCQPVAHVRGLNTLSQG